jgi:hypothetical protein
MHTFSPVYLLTYGYFLLIPLFDSESIDLSDNQFHGSIPKAVGMLSRLEYLSLNNNKFSGQIPASIGLLSSLSTCTLG